ncbi:MAG: hypothetical protein K0Q55_2145 [Verrucomicrobia bacterium]|nr:hypothetical protein [Verrucomicrobiota bacterium]
MKNAAGETNLQGSLPPPFPITSTLKKTTFHFWIGIGSAIIVGIILLITVAGKVTNAAQMKARVQAIERLSELTPNVGDRLMQAERLCTQQGYSLFKTMTQQGGTFMPATHRG